jgi:glyoxylate reductase
VPDGQKIAGRVFVTRDLAPPVIQRLRDEFSEVDVWEPYGPPAPRELAERTTGCVALLTMVSDRVDAALLDAAPTLKVVANMAVGYNNVDIAAAAARGVVITNTPNVLEETTADMAFALMLAVARRVVESDADTRAGNWGLWHPGLWLGNDVHGATLGIVGLGTIGSAVARRAGGFDMRIKYTARNRQSETEAAVGAEYVPDLRDLLGQSDFVSLHVPLTDATRDLIGVPEFRAMKSTAYLINTSRGDVVNTDALLAALQDGAIAGAGIDVTAPEPIPPDHPLLKQSNLVITPHLGSATHATRIRMAMLAAENAIAACTGAPVPNAVTG